jgi:FkbM family methyltransferase
MQIDSIASLATGTRRELKNWATTATLGCIVSPSRFLPPWNPLLQSPLAKRRLLLKLRNGLEIECRAEEFAPFLEIFVTRAYEEAGIPWDEVTTVVDIGANVGMATLWIAQRAPRARIVAVEPARAAYRELAANVARNELTDHVSTVRAAIGATAGTGRLDRVGASVNGRLVATGGEEVRLMTLDDLLTTFALETVDLLKLDCEGAEFDILLGASTQTLGRIRCIVGEYHHVDGHQPEELVRVLEDGGFNATFTPDLGGLGIFHATRT